MKKYDNYKDSGIEWLGEIPQQWGISKAKFEVNIINGFAFKSEDFQDEGIPVIRIGDLKPPYVDLTNSKCIDITKYKDLSDYSVQKGDLLLAMTGATIGKTATYNNDKFSFLNQRVGLIKPYKNNNKQFITYIFESIFFKEFVSLECSGSAQENIGKSQLGELTLAMPTIEEQTAIANFLDYKTTQIDTFIAKKEQFIRLLQEERTAVINQAVTKGLDLKAKMKDSGIEWLGEIPEHWEVPKLKFVCEFILDGTHGSHPRVEVGYRLLSVRNIINGKFVFRDDDSCVSEEEYNNISSKFKIMNNDIQLAIVGATLGKVAIVDDMSEDFVTQRSLATIRSINSICIPNYLHNFMKSSTFQSYLWLNTGFSAQPGVYLGTLQNCTIPLPSISEQIEIVSSINNINNRIDSIISKSQQEIELLKEYKTALISEVVTGKVDVRDEVLI